MRAYEMQRSDKHLYLVWPRVMAALREYDKARVSGGVGLAVCLQLWHFFVAV